MGQDTYTNLDGKTVHLDLTPKEHRFFFRVEDASQDPGFTQDDMTSLVYGPDNPILNHDMLPGRHMVDDQAANHPLFKVLEDLIFRHRELLGTYNHKEANQWLYDRCTMSVKDASTILGISPQAVYKAIHAGYLVHSKREGRGYLLYPPSVHSYA